jgi:hypothetical protein
VDHFLFLAARDGAKKAEPQQLWNTVTMMIASSRGCQLLHFVLPIITW